MNQEISINNFKIANNLPFALIAGPCQTESLDHSLMISAQISSICQELDINFIYKSSFDKANRSSITSKRGLGIDKTLEIFAKVKDHLNCPILTDIHNEEHQFLLKNLQILKKYSLPHQQYDFYYQLRLQQ